MNSLKHLKKLGGIMLGAMGFSALISSCAKERTCACSYTDGTETYEVFEVTIEGKCEDADASMSYAPLRIDLECVEK